MPNFMITGTNFLNKGAQSMLFTCTEELRSRFPDSKIYYKAAVGLGNIKLYDNYHFIPVYVCPESYDTIDYSIIKTWKILFRIAKSTILFLLNKGHRPLEVLELRKVIRSIDYYIDASGYCLTSKWGIEAHKDYYSNFTLAKKNNAKVFLMPQSFGPFSYSKNLAWLDKKNKEVLTEASLIFSREQEGRELLKTHYQITNVLTANDMVLLTDKLKPSLVYKIEREIIVPSVVSGSVGIVPNIRCLKNGNEEKVFELYRIVIRKILEQGKCVYIFRHSSEDLDMCRKIAVSFKNNEKVFLIENDFDCFETSEFVSKFIFIIGARYHSVIHAYRRHVPCILFGWAVKYQELAKSLGQFRFVFDITDDKINTEGIVNSILYLLENYEVEANNIKNALEKLRSQNNCFDILEQYIREHDGLIAK